MEGDNRIRLLLASGSPILLEGISGIIKGDPSNIEVATNTTDENIAKSLARVKPRFLFLDNRILNYDVKELLQIIARETPNTEVILFKNRGRRAKLNFPGVIYITRKTNTSELIKIIRNDRLGKL